MIGMMHELEDLQVLLHEAYGVDPRTPYERRLEMFRRNIYGVDIDPYAVTLARLRVHPALISVSDGDEPPYLPTDAELRIRCGDALLGPVIRPEAAQARMAL